MSASLAGGQRGAALLALLLVLALGGAWYLTSRLNAASANLVATNRAYNAAVLAQAKQALIGYVAHQAAVSNEDNPGAFPCPETPSGFTSTSGTDGRTQTPNCTLPAVGRFPWRTIGSEKFVDAAGEPLWYVVASGWSKPGAAGNTIINSNCTDAVSGMTCYTGQLTVDGQSNAAVALIIAPGPAFNVPAAAGCAAWNQTRPTSANPQDLRNYLECENATSPADLSFVTTGASGSFNDQVIKITAVEVLPLIEAAVADRFQKEFGTGMRTAYSSVAGLWPATPVLPFAAPFGDPTMNPANKLQGSAGTAQGLLPGSYAFTASPGSAAACSPAPCTPTACTSGSDPRCDPAFVSWQGAATTITRTGGANLQSYSCSTSGTPSTLTCVLRTYTDLLAPVYWMRFSVSAQASNVGMTLRQLNGTVPIAGLDTAALNSPYGYSLTPATLNNDGSATVNMDAQMQITTGSLLDFLVGGVLCSIAGLACYENTVSIPMAVLSDHALVDPSNTAYNWFFRNRWHEVTYYAVAPGIAPGGGGSCTTGSTCLQVNYSPDAGKHRALLIIGGQKLATKDAIGNPYIQTRPATAVKDLLDNINAAGASPFEQRSPTLAINRAFNDHFAAIDKNP